jgi:hypothetical protein
LNEEEDDWNFTAGPEWNETELVVGDYITPEMWKENWWGIESYPGFKIVKFKVSKTTLPNGNVNTSNFFVLEYKDRSGKLKRASYNVKHFNDNFLKPNFKITPPKLNEQDEDEFSQEFIAGDEWNVTDLNVGDVVTPEMWNHNKIENISSNIIRDKEWFYQPHKITKFRQTYLDFVIFDNNKELSLNFVKDFLKPTFKIDFNGLNEQDEDEWDLEAGPEWNEYDGTVVITYILEDEGFIYLQEDDLEDFESLNPGALNKFDYNYEPIRETNVYRSKPIHIRDLISELDELVGVQAQPYIGEKTTQGFKDWMADNGIVIDSLAYLYDTLSPTPIETSYSDEYGNPVKITPKMKDRIDYNDDGMFYGGVIDVKFNDRLTESDGDWNLEAGPEWNEKELKVGDYYNKYTGEVFSNEDEIPNDIKHLTYKIIYIGPNEGEYYNPNYFDYNIIIIQSLNGIKYAFTIDHFNIVYGPKLNAYIPTDSLNEQDDEWEFEAGKEWNEKEIKVGDYWYESSNPEWNGVWSNYYDIPDRISDLVLKVIYIGPHKEEFSKPPYNDIPNYYGEYVIISKRNGKFWAFTVDYFNNNFGKRLNAYVPTDNLNEQDDEWDLEAGPEWNETLLSLGDKITPDMWDEKSVIAAGEEDEFLEGETWDINELDNDRITIESNGGGFLIWGIDDVQALLKPQYKIVVKKDLFEEEDEWDLEAGPEWNVTELGIDDTITPEMWNKNLSPEYGNIGDWIDNPAEDQIIDGIDTDDHGVVGIWFTGKKSNIQNIYTLMDFNNLLDPKYRIIPPLTESEDDDWDFEAGDEWNVQELTTGDVITPDMWNNDLPDEWYDEFQGWEMEIDDFQAGNEVVVLIGSGVYYVDLEEFNSYLEPKYKIVPPLYEQEEDEWDLEAGEEWNTKELTTGDVITSDMVDSNKNNNWFYERDTLIKKMNFQRDAIDPEYLVFLVDLDSNGNEIYGTDRMEWIGIINNKLIPPYKVVPPLNEQEDEDWDLEAGEEWNTKELTTGDYITPDMWDWQEIGAFIDRMNDDDHEEYRRDWKEWEEGTKNPIKILKIHGSGVSTYPELDSYLFRWGPNIRFINTMLKPEFKVIST